MGTTDNFTGKASIYSEFRPNYPLEYIQYLVKFNHLTSTHTVADIGAGTGILTRQLLEQQLRVIAIEPNSDMRAIAIKSLNHYERFASLSGAAEHTSLPSHSVDLITVAQAFHWFDKDQFKVECQRILKPDAYVALVWNSRVASSELIIENAELCKEYCPSFHGFSGGIDETPDMYKLFFRNGIYDYQEFDNPLQFVLNSFIGRNLSASYAPKPTDDHYSDFVQSLTKLFNKYCEGSVLSMPNRTRSYIGQV